MKYYKVIKANPLWEVGAILHSDRAGDYVGVQDIWDKFENMSEYLSAQIIEGSPDFFQRVYESPSRKLMYITKAQLKKTYKKFKK